MWCLVFTQIPKSMSSSTVTQYRIYQKTTKKSHENYAGAKVVKDTDEVVVERQGRGSVAFVRFGTGTMKCMCMGGPSGKSTSLIIIRGYRWASSLTQSTFCIVCDVALPTKARSVGDF